MKKRQPPKALDAIVDKVLAYDRRKTGEGGMKGWATRRRNGTDSPRQLRAEIERLKAALEYIQNLPLGDELDIARRAARRALEGK